MTAFRSARFASCAPDFLLAVLLAAGLSRGAGNAIASALAAAALAAVVIYRVREKNILAIILVVSGLAAGFAGRQSAGSPEEIPRGAHGVSVEIERTVTGFPEVLERGDDGRYVFAARSGRLRIVSPYARLLYPSEKVVLRGTLYSYEYGGRAAGTIYLNERQDGSPDLLERAGIPVRQENLSAVETVSRGFVPFLWISRLRLAVTDELLKVPDPELRGLYAAFALGDRNLLGYRVRQSFQMAGLAHLLAISGMHVALIAAGVALVLRLWMRERAAYAVTAAVVVFYAAVAGFQASMVRAAAMFVAFDVLKAAGREPDFLEVLLAVWIGSIVLYPPVIDQAGFWLSFGATAGVVVLTGPIACFLRLPGAPGEVLAGTLAANAAVLPLTVYYFKSVSVLFPLSNVAAVLVFTPLSYLVFARLVASGLGLTWVLGPLDFAAKGLWEFTTAAADVFSRPKWSYVRIGDIGHIGLTVCYIALFAVLIVFPRIRRARAESQAEDTLIRAVKG